MGWFGAARAIRRRCSIASVCAINCPASYNEQERMARMRIDKLVRRWFPVVACAPLILLTGWPQENAAAPGKTPVQATAPTAASEPATTEGTQPVAPPTKAQQAEAA